MSGISGALGAQAMMAELLTSTLEQTKALIAAGAALKIQEQAQAIALDGIGENIDLVA